MTPANTTHIIRAPVEVRCQQELEKAQGVGSVESKPRMAPLAPRGGECLCWGFCRWGFCPKYVGDRERVQVAIATLASDRALLWWANRAPPNRGSRNTSTPPSATAPALTVQGAAGTTEDQIRYRGTTPC